MGRIENWREWLTGEEGLLEFFEVNKEVLPLQNPIVQRSLMVEKSKSSFCRDREIQTKLFISLVLKKSAHELVQSASLPILNAERIFPQGFPQA
jgi:hypothetical protein